MTEQTQTTESTEPKDESQGALAGAWFAIVVHAVGAAMALTPLHWYAAGLIIAFFGTLFFAGSWRTDYYTIHPEGSLSRRRGRTTGYALVLYSIAVFAAGGLAGLTSPDTTGVAVTLGVSVFVSFLLGIRQLTAYHGRQPIKPLIQAFRVRTRLQRWLHRVNILFFVAVTIAAGIVYRTSGGAGVLLVVAAFLGMLAYFMSIAVLGGRTKTRKLVVIVGIMYPVLMVGSLVAGHQGWLTFMGTAQNCTYLESDYDDGGTRGGAYTTYSVQCGHERLEYRPTQTVGYEITTNQVALVTDRTGLTQPLRPPEVPGLFGTAYLTILTIYVAGLGLFFYQTSGRREE